MDLPTRCYACGATGHLADGQRCACGEPLWLDTDPAGLDWPPDAADRSLWRFRELLPDVTSSGLAATAGGTPLVRAHRLDADLGVRAHVKFEGAAPTGTFKDRGSAVGVAVAAAAGDRAVGTVSHGNMARSMAAHAASADLECVVLVPADIPTERLELVARHDPTIRRVAGSYGDLYGRSLALGHEHGIRFVNSDTPLRVAGQKTTGLEILEAFAPDVPDAIVMPVSSGGHASGIWKACREVVAAGHIDTPPAIFLTQAAPCAPIAEAWDRGDDSVSPVERGETVAYSIANADPPSGNRALAAARETGGGVVAVSDATTLEARATLAEATGLFAETACATALAGARALAESGEFSGMDDVVLVATGTGYTERSVDSVTVDAPTVEQAALGEVLADIGRD